MCCLEDGYTHVVFVYRVLCCANEPNELLFTCLCSLWCRHLRHERIFLCVCVCELCRLVRTAYRRYVRYAHLVSEPVDVLVFMGVWCLIIRLIPAHTGSLFWKRLYHVTARSKTTCRVEITNRCTSVLCTYRCVGPDGDRVRL